MPSRAKLTVPTMANHKGWIRRLERNARSNRAILKMRDGSTRSFGDMEVFGELFLVRVDLMCGRKPSSYVLDAVRAATPESRAAFERKYGSIEMVAHVLAADYQGGWVEEYRLLEDGTVESIRYEGGTEEAEEIKQAVRQRQGDPAL
jgi:hypothetical protein